MRLPLIIFFLTLFIAETSHGQCDYKLDSQKIVTHRNLDALLNLVETTKLVTKNNKNFIPFFIIQQINCWLTKTEIVDSFTIANPKEPYNNTDLIITGLPDRQLVYLGVSKNLLLLTYHYGAGAGTHNIMIVKFTGSKILDFWVGQAAKLKSKKAVLTWLRKYKHENEVELII